MKRASWYDQDDDIPHYGQMGSAYAISDQSTEPDAIELLHDAVEAVTGERPRAESRRIGFLP